MIKYTPQFLKQIEEIYQDIGYKVRYEKGNFRSGYCIIQDQKVIVLNKFSAIESRITTMIDILKQFETDNLLESQLWDDFKSKHFKTPKPEKVKEES